MFEVWCIVVTLWQHHPAIRVDNLESLENLENLDHLAAVAHSSKKHTATGENGSNTWKSPSEVEKDKLEAAKDKLEAIVGKLQVQKDELEAKLEETSANLEVTSAHLEASKKKLNATNLKLDETYADLETEAKLKAKLDKDLKCHDDYHLSEYVAAVRKLGPWSTGRAYSCKYDYAVNSIKAHSYVAVGQEAINCYDLPPFSNTTAQKWHLSGCTPFRSVSSVVKQTMNCVQVAVKSSNFWLPDDDLIMQRASKYAWEASPARLVLKLKDFLRRELAKTLADFEKQLTQEWWDDHEQVLVAENAVLACFKKDDAGEHQIAMRCLPSLWGRVGFGVGGLRNEGLIYRKYQEKIVAESLRFNCQKPEGKKCKEQCAEANALEPLACPRIAVASMAHFCPKRYAEKGPALRWLLSKASTTLSSGPVRSCKHVDRNIAANCWLFTFCVHYELQAVCKAFPGCCPDGRLGLHKASPLELQTVVTENAEDADKGAAWAAGVEKLANQQRLFQAYGCRESEACAVG